MTSSPPKVIVLVGPTASGKTELAIEIAKYFKTRIHNIDSRQVYLNMNIGTAKPTNEQQKQFTIYTIRWMFRNRNEHVCIWLRRWQKYRLYFS